MSGIFMLAIIIYGGYLIFLRVIKRKNEIDADDRGAIRMFVGFVLIPAIILIIILLFKDFLIAQGESLSKSEKMIMNGAFILINIYVSCWLGFKIESVLLSGKNQKR